MAGSRLPELAERYAGGDETALADISPAIYQELKQVARNHLRHERAGHTLQPTAVVNEAYVRMCEATGLHWQDRAHFFRLASRVMRNLLVDHARARQAEKRGGDAPLESLDRTAMDYHERCTQHLFGKPDEDDTALDIERDFVALDAAMVQLRRLNPRQAEVVDLRFFGGLSVDETAQTLAIAAATVKRDWTVARAFLRLAIDHDRG
jgi:RNA polymerase sigma factor (sigma-70 family)